MNQKSLLILVRFVFLLLIFLQNIVPNNAQNQQAQELTSQARPFADLTLELTVPQQKLLPLQPIPIVLKQSNKTNQQVFGYKSLGFELPIYLYVQKTGSSQKVQIKKVSLLRQFATYTNVEIAPMESYEVKEWLTLSLNKYFPEPGTYELQALLFNADKTQSIESNMITIEIQQPLGVDYQAYNLVKTSRMPETLFSGVEFDEAKDTLEEISTRFPSSAYAKSSFYVLGKAYFYRKQYPKALANLIRLENDRGFIFASKVKDFLEEIRQSQSNQQ